MKYACRAIDVFVDELDLAKLSFGSLSRRRQVSRVKVGLIAKN